MMNKNDQLTVEIDGYTSEGAGVAHAEGMAVFVPGTIAGERAQVQLLKVKKTFVYAKPLRIETASPARIVPDCPVYPRCGGCALRHMTYAEELRYKEQKVRDALTRIAGVQVPMDPILPSPATDGYRNRAQFPVGGEPPVCGFYRVNSHDIIPTDACRLQTPEASAAAQAVLGWMRRYHVPAYDELSGKGLIRHICVRTSFEDRRTVLTLVASADLVPHIEALMEAVTAACPHVSGIVLNINPDRTNVILGRTFRTLYGSDTLTETLGKLRFTLRPASFFQVNPRQAANLYGLARAFLTAPPDDGGEPFLPRRLLDLYCGTGTIGLFCADVCEHVTGVEIVEDAIRDARENAQMNGITNADFHCGDAGAFAADAVSQGLHFDAVIVDPPRKGLSEEAAAMLLSLAPERIVYVSCDPATLARDITRLSRTYTPVRARAVDMFPRTAHVETVVLMSRKDT